MKFVIEFFSNILNVLFTDHTLILDIKYFQCQLSCAWTEHGFTSFFHYSIYMFVTHCIKSYILCHCGYAFMFVFVYRHVHACTCVYAHACMPALYTT